MKLEDFILDSSTNIYVNKAAISQINYLDGAERYLQEVLMSTHDLSLLSAELKSRIKDWPSRYHLSPYRVTILDCFDFQKSEARILELGAGCGAVTRWLGEHFQDVYAVEGSFQRACIVRQRCRDLPNVKVYAANFLDLDLENQFDIVTLIGVLEYSHLYHPEHRKNPYEASLSALKLVHRAIKDQGVLLLAIENKLGLKYFSGAQEDHSGKLFDGIQGYPNADTPVTFSAAELEILLKNAGFTSVDFYLPFPDYKLAKTIINAQALSSHHHYLYNWIETPFPDRVTEQRTLLFNESLALREISKAGLLKDLANSFLIVAHKGEKDANYKKLGFSDKDWIARHYSLNRYRTFCKKVSLLKTDSGSLRVNNNNAFGTTFKESPSNSFFTHTFLSENFVRGDLLLFSIFEMLVSDTFDTMFQPLLEQLNKFLLDHFSMGQKDEMGMSLLSGGSLDVALWNIIIEEKTGEWVIIDQEFTFNALIPVDFILCRNLHHFFVRYKAYFDKDKKYSVKSINELTYEYMQKIYPTFNKERFLLAMQLDQSFQNFVNCGTSYQETLPIPAKLCQQSVLIKDSFQETKEKSTPPVSIVIPVYNRIEYTQKCLEALIQNTPGDLYELIIVDNASTDGTKDFLKELKGNIRIITNEENLGFAKACNQGVQIASCDYILFLNNDTEFKSGWIEPLIHVIDKDNTVAAVGSKLLFPDGTIQHAGVMVIDDKKLPDPLVARHIYYQQPDSILEANRMMTYQVLTAACLMIRKSAFEEVGGFDEGYWNGYEDVDLCFKLQQKGWKLVYQPESVVIHYESKSGPERFTRAPENITRLHQKWLGKIKPDIIIEKDGSVKLTDAGHIQPYSLPIGDKPAVPPISLLTSIIILTHNQLEHTKLCIESIKRYTPEPHEIIIVDNGSTDSTLDYLKDAMATTDSIRVISNSTNRGFAAGNNQGISIACGEYVLLLNNDTVVTEGWLRRMLNIFKQYPKTGIVGPMSNYTSGPQLAPEANYKNIEEMEAFAARWAKEHDGQSFPIYRVVGFCLLTKREIIDKIGGLDEQFGSGNFEDDDFCIRAALAGYESQIAQDVFIHHTGSQTFKGAGIDYGKSLLRNWELFKAKWGVPIDTPYGKGYRIPLKLPPGISLFVTLPDVSSDHIVDESKRWFKETCVQVIQKQRKHGLTSLIVLTSNQFSHTKKCIKSIRKNTPEPNEIIVVDNGFSDKTTNWLRKRVHEDPAFKLIKGNSNIEYAKACNQAIAESSGEYILLMHDDVVVTAGWLTGMLECLNSVPDAGIVGPITVNIDGPQKVIITDYNSIEYPEQFAKAFREKNRHRRVPSRKIDNCCMLFRQELVEKAGWLDEQFDSHDFAVEDYCLRVSLEGYKNLVAGDVFLHYYGQESFTGEKTYSAALRFKNKNLFITKWSNPDETSQIKLFTLNALTAAEELLQKGQIDNALAALIEGIKLNPDDRRLHFKLAEILIENKKFNEATGILENMPENLRQDSKYLELIAYCKEGMGLSEEAERCADKALLLNNASPRALNIKGLIAFKKGLHVDAEKFFYMALEADRGFGEAYTNLGALRWITGKKEEAFKLFEKAFILSPAIGDIVTNYYSAVVSLSRLKEAASIFKEAIALYPLSRRLKFILIDNLQQQGKYHEAMGEMEEAMISFGIDDNTLTVALAMRDKAGPKEIDRSSSDTISLCMIVKDEEDKIGQCLMRIKPVVDEMVVVDTGSNDRTKGIAKAFGAKVYDFKWTDSFADARNFSLSKASGKWILVLDADEVISSYDHEALREVVTKTSSRPVAYSFVTRNYIFQAGAGWTANDGRYIEEAGTGWFPGEKVRLFPNDMRIRFENPVHELVEFSLLKSGIEIKKCDIPVHHYGKLNREKIASKGEDYYELGKIKIADKGEQDVGAIYELALQAFELKRHDEAIEYFKKVVAVKPDFLKAFYFMGSAYFHLGRYEDALLSLKRAMQLAPDSRDIILLYSECEICAGNPETSIALLEALLRKDPEHPIGMLALTVAYFCNGRKEEGLEYVEKLRTMNFPCAGYFNDFAKRLVSVKRVKYAILLLGSALESKEMNNETHLLLSEFYKIKDFK